MPLSTLQVQNSNLNLISRHGFVYNVSDHLDCVVIGSILLKYVGKDVSHLFEIDGSIKQSYNPFTGLLCEMIDGCALEIPHGLVKWWEEIPSFDTLSKEEFYIQIQNTLTGQSEIKLVCVEDTIKSILCKYELSCLAAKNGNRYMDIDKTVQENGVVYQFDLPTLYLVFVPE